MLNHLGGKLLFHSFLFAQFASEFPPASSYSLILQAVDLCRDSLSGLSSLAVAGGLLLDRVNLISICEQPTVPQIPAREFEGKPLPTLMELIF